MKKYIYLVIPFILWLTPALINSCAPPLMGIRVWNIATKNIFITQTIESILDGISGIDAVAVFSDLDQLLDKVTTVESKASLLLQEIDILQNDLVHDLSKTQIIQSTIGLLESSFALLDTSAVFTALDALQTTIVSAMDLLNNDLESIVTHIDNITASEIDYAQTIASQLDRLDIDVQIVNSLLDALSTQFSLTTFFSLTDILQQDFVAIESNLQILDNQIAIGFAGTFTMLDQNLLLAQTIESLADELEIIQGSDLTGTYSLLDQLDISVQTMDSLADELINSYATIISSIDILGSALDQSVSKYVFVESRTSLLTDKIESLVTNPAFSMIDHATSLLDRDISLLSQIYDADLPALTSSIESKLDHIINQQDVQISDLDAIATAFSQIPTLPSEITTISKLDKINSILDDVIADAFATESYINAATHIETINDAQSLLQQINYTDSLVPQISSKMTLVNNNLATTNSTLDVITSLAQNNLNTITSVQSLLDAHSFIPQPSSSISSSLSLINSQEDAVISKLAVASNQITTANNDAQGLIGDFQSTWTILRSIDTKLAQAYNTLSLTDRAIQSKFVSYSSVFTAIDTIVRNEATVNSQVDVYNSMVNVLTNKINTDFNGVFTALTSVNSSVASSSSALATISSKLSIVQTEFGFPIYTRNIPLTITTPGRYYLAENINYNGATTAITINTNNVSIDLNGRTLRYTGASTNVAGIIINNVDNVRIINGTVQGFINVFNNLTTGGISGATSSTNVIIKDVVIINSQIFFGGGRNHVVKNCIVLPASSFGIAMQAPTNVDIVDSIFSGFTGECVYISGNVNNLCMENCISQSAGAGALQAIVGCDGVTKNCFFKNIYGVAGTRGIVFDIGTSSGTIVSDSYFAGMQSQALAISGTNNVIKNNTVINSLVGLTNGTIASNPQTAANFFIGFNTFIQNTSANINLIGANTYLGNFAFNTNAVGSPNNTNYTLSGSSITGKFITISQRTGISGITAPTYWHNINMLP